MPVEGMARRTIGTRVLCASALLTVVGIVALALGPDQFSSSADSSTGPEDAPVFSTAPIPRINVGDHVAAVRTVDADAAGRFLVTGSVDKTIKIWSLPALSLIQTLRIPIVDAESLDRENAEVGQVNAVAITPDGSRVAAGGIFTRERRERVYLFDRVTGRMLAPLTGMNSSVVSLAFSRDGALLAAGLHNKGRGGVQTVPGGVRVWDMQSRTVVLADTDYQGAVRGLAFGRDGKLVAAAEDGSLRIYTDKLRKRVVRKVGPGQPHTIAFEPNGERYAVVFQPPDEPARIAVFGGDDQLLWQRAYGGPDDNPGGFDAVEWSADAAFLYAGGTMREGNAKVVRKLDAKTGTIVEDFSALKTLNRIKGIKRVGANAFAVASEEPSLGLYSDNGAVLKVHPNPLIDMRSADTTDAFRVSSDGTIVDIPNVDGHTYRFDVTSYALSVDPGPDSRMKPPLQSASGLTIDLREEREPPQNPVATKTTPNGTSSKHELVLEPGERGRSYALSPDGDKIAIGGDWSLRLFSAEGKLLWRAPSSSPDTTWRVNFSGDGRYLIAAYGDGSVRWHRVDNGWEILALVIEPSTGHWVMWSPSGFYEASVSGDALIGWHVNQGPDREALFYDAARFKDIYLRTGLGREVLRSGVSPDGPQRSTLLNVLPPVVRILDVVQKDERTVDVSYQIDSPTGHPVSELIVVSGGARLQPRFFDAPLQTGKTSKLEVEVPPDAVNLTISAATAERIGEPATRGLARELKEQPLVKRRLFAVVLGVDGYTDPTVSKLQFARNDALDIERALRTQEGGGVYSKVDVVSLREGAELRDITDALEKLVGKSTRDDDVSLIFLAGHGTTVIEPNGASEFYFLPRSASPADLHATALSGTRLHEFIRRMNGRKLLFLDACRSGQVNNAMIANALGDRPLQALVFAAATDAAPSYEDPQIKHGYFTYELLNGMAGGADSSIDPDKRIAFDELSQWLRDRVKVDTRQHRPPQIPTIRGDGIPQEAAIFAVVPRN